MNSQMNLFSNWNLGQLIQECKIQAEQHDLIFETEYKLLLLPRISTIIWIIWSEQTERIKPHSLAFGPTLSQHSCQKRNSPLCVSKPMKDTEVKGKAEEKEITSCWENTETHIHTHSPCYRRSGGWSYCGRNV